MGTHLANCLTVLLELNQLLGEVMGPKIATYQDNGMRAKWVKLYQEIHKYCNEEEEEVESDDEGVTNAQYNNAVNFADRIFSDAFD